MSEVIEAGPRVLVPGLANLPPGVERYRIRGGAVTALLLSAGDTLEINGPYMGSVPTPPPVKL